MLKTNNRDASIIDALLSVFEALPQQAVEITIDGNKIGRALLPKFILEQQRLGLVL